MVIYQKNLTHFNHSSSDCLNKNHRTVTTIEQSDIFGKNSFYSNYQRFLEQRKKLYPDLEFGNSLWSVIMQIYDCDLKEEIIYISNIGQMAQIPQTTVLRHLDTLTKKDLVWKIRHFSDKRMVRVRLSPMFKNQLDDLFIKLSDGVLV